MGKLVLTEIEFNKLYELNKNEFLSILNFIKQNQSIKKNIELYFNSKLFLPETNSTTRLHNLFIDCINAAGGNNLTLTGKSCELFWKIISRLEQKKGKLDFDEFLSILSKQNQLNDRSLINQMKMFKNFGDKKAALFVNKLYWIQNNANEDFRIFNHFSLTLNDLAIPIDNVIIRVLNQIFCFDFNKKLDQSKHFYMLNNFFKKELKNDYLLIEDFWFWGYICTEGNGINRVIKFNDAKFYSSDFIEPKPEYIHFFEEFINLVNRN